MLAGALAACLLACKRERAPRPAGPVPSLKECPSERFIEELHATAFYFQQGWAAPAREHLRLATALSPSHPDPVSLDLLSRLSDVSVRLDVEPEWGASETERVRAALGDWPCLTEALHRRLHEELPPVP